MKLVQLFNRLYQCLGPSVDCFNFFWLSRNILNTFSSSRFGISTSLMKPYRNLSR